MLHWDKLLQFLQAVNILDLIDKLHTGRERKSVCLRSCFDVLSMGSQNFPDGSGNFCISVSSVV